MKRVFKLAFVFLLIGIAALYFWPEKRYQPFKVSDDYQRQVDNYHIPDMPPDWQWHDYQVPDGTSLRWGETGNRDAAKASLIFVPGYTATLDMYGEHFDQLARRGYHVLGLDMRGQGGSQRHREAFPEKLWVENFGVYGSDINAWLADMNLPDDRPVILAGSSFGGNTVIRAAGDFTGLPIDGLYLLAPAIQPRTGEYSFEQSLSLLNRFNWLGRGKRYVLDQTDWRPESNDLTTTSDCSSYAKRLHYRDVIFTNNPEQRVGGPTNRWFYEFLKSSEHINRETYLSKITVPVTIVTAEMDAFVDNDTNAKACSDYFNDCRETIIPESKHCLMQENDAVLEQMFDEVDSLLARITSGPF